MPDFSVIIPACDRPEFLQAALASVAAQRGASFEVIVVNDGRQPVTAERVIETGGYRGHVVARNLGIAAARGKWIAFLDDDDRWIDSLQLASALRSPGFYHAAGIFEFADGSPPRVFNLPADAASLARDNTILISTVCYEKSLHDRLGPFDEALTYYADWDWYLRVARAGVTIGHGQTPAAEITIHAGNMSGNDAAEARQAGLDALCRKHGLTGITLKNHLNFLENPALTLC